MTAAPGPPMDAAATATGAIRAALAERAPHIAPLPPAQVDVLASWAVRITAAQRAGGTLFTFGNGGSAADAEHLAAELVGRYHHDRRPLAAVALTTNTAALTAIANDYGFEHVFARQVHALAGPDDVVLGITTSGRSPNVLAGLVAAGDVGAHRLALVGAGATEDALTTDDTDGLGPVLADSVLVVAPDHTPGVQEAHRLGEQGLREVDAGGAVENDRRQHARRARDDFGVHEAFLRGDDRLLRVLAHVVDIDAEQRRRFDRIRVRQAIARARHDARLILEQPAL